LLQVNVQYLDIFRLSFYNYVYSVLSPLSNIIPNNGDAHKSSMYQNVQTCILELNRTRIGIKILTLIVLPYNTITYYPKLKST